MVTGPLLARMLGPDGRGYLAALILWPIVITQLGNLGIPSALTYSIARDSSASRALARLGLAFALPQALLLIVFQALWLLLILHGDPHAVRVAGWLTLALVPAMLAQQYGLGLLQGHLRLRLFNGLRLLPWALYAVGVATLFVAGDHAIEPIVGALVTAFLISGTACLLCGLRFSRGDGPRFRRPAVSPLLRAARPAVEPVGCRRAAARPGRTGAVPLTLGVGAVRRRPGVYESAVLHRQERRIDHLPLGRLATGGGRCAPDDVVAPVAHHRNSGRHRRRPLRVGALAGSLLLRGAVRRRRHGHLHRAARDDLPRAREGCCPRG